MKRLAAWLGAFLSVTALVSTACGHYIEGAAAVGSRTGDPAFFFAGDVPTYGQTVSSNDKGTLAYLRAMRRVDVCGLADRQSFAKIGEISSLGTLYALNECDVEIKMPGDPGSKFVSVELVLGRAQDSPAFRVGGTPIYETAEDSCEYELPLDLSHLPGGTQLRKPDQPFLRVGVIGTQDCALTKKLAAAIAERVSTRPLPPRDAAAVYPTPLAERDPCEVLSTLGEDVDHWDVNRTRPYECEFSIWRIGYPEVLSIRVALEPKIVDVATEGTDHRVIDGADVYLDSTFCSAVTFVGPTMQRRLAGGDFVDVANVEVRPAVVVDGGDSGCDAALDIAAQAAKLY